MLKRCLVLFMSFFLVCIGISSCTQEKSTNRIVIVSERLIGQIDFSSCLIESFKISPDSKRVAYAARVGNKWFVVVDGKEEKQYDGIGKGTPIFSPDNKRVAYAVVVGNKRFVVVDGKEEKQYDGIGKGTPIFSPDSKRVAYMAKVGNKCFVVVDGKEEKQYDVIVAIGGGRIIFDSPDSLHYLAIKGEGIFLVEERTE